MSSTGTPVAGVNYYYDSATGQFKSPGYDPLETVAPSGPQLERRVNPTRGTYLSNDRRYTGILPGWTKDMYANRFAGAGGYISITSPGPYRDTIFWGGVKMQSPVKPVFDNCIFAGTRPDLKLSDGCIRAYVAGTDYQFSVYDSLVDPTLWMDTSLAGYSTWSVPSGYRYPGDKVEFFKEFNRGAGLHGGSGSFYRVEITNTVDSVNSVQSRTAGEFTWFEDCWLHDNHYYRDPDPASAPTQTGGYHSDCFQFSVGTNITILGGFFGGVRGDYGNDRSDIPIVDAMHENPGHDPHNACIMLKQEATSDPARLLANILIDGVVLQGGVYTVNHYYNSATLANTMDTVRLRNLKIVKAPVGAENGQNAYIGRNPVFAGCYDTNSNRLITLNGDGTWNDLGVCPVING